MNLTVKNKVVEPFEVVGAAIELFSVFTQTIVCATPEKSKILTVDICPSTALAVVRVIVNVAAELFVTVVSEAVTATVAALPAAVTAVFVVITEAKVCDPVNVWAAFVIAKVPEVLGSVIVILLPSDAGAITPT